MSKLKMPIEREFGWPLKDTSSSSFEIITRENGQFCVVLNHSLLRGCRAEMIHWWFQNFCNLRILLPDTPGYQDKKVPAYLLWHPSDHYNASLSGRLGSGGEAIPGSTIHIQEAMQYEKYGWKYPVDSKLSVFYVGPDGWAMGRKIPFFGPLMMLRIHFRDIKQNGAVTGVHYHYEIVIGVSANNVAARFLNKQISKEFGPEFFEAWHRHNVIEVGVFENFLPALYAQKNDPSVLEYRLSMNPISPGTIHQTAFSQETSAERIKGYKEAEDPFEYQGFQEPSFL